MTDLWNKKNIRKTLMYFLNQIAFEKFPINPTHVLTRNRLIYDGEKDRKKQEKKWVEERVS